MQIISLKLKLLICATQADFNFTLIIRNLKLINNLQVIWKNVSPLLGLTEIKIADSFLDWKRSDSLIWDTLSGNWNGDFRLYLLWTFFLECSNLAKVWLVIENAIASHYRAIVKQACASRMDE